MIIRTSAATWSLVLLASAHSHAQNPRQQAATTPCFNSSIMSPTPFMGNNGEVFKLADGSIWEIRYEYEYPYEYYPKVVVCPDRGKIYLKSKSLNVARLSPAPKKESTYASEMPAVIESRIDGEFEGWEGESIFKLQNGQIWEQVSYAYTYHYAYSPGVLIYKSGSVYKMKVDGVDDTITVRRIR